MSFAVYPHIKADYQLLSTGASIQEGTGPVVVSSAPLDAEQLREGVVAVPGNHTSSLLALKRWMPGVRTRVVPFEAIPSEVLTGKALAGLVIDECQADYARRGLSLVVDLGQWWWQAFRLPLPMGGMAIRASLQPELKTACLHLLRESIRTALDRQEACLDHVAALRPGIDRETLATHIRSWVNPFSLDPGPVGRRAVAFLLGMTPDWIEA